MRTRNITYSSATQTAQLLSEIGWGTVNTSYDVSDTKVTEDCVIPYARRILRVGGILPYNPFRIAHHWNTATPSNTTITRTSDGKKGEYGTQYLTISSTYFNDPALPGEDSGLISYVTNAAIAEAKAASFDALTAMAEYGKTHRMIVDRVHGVFNYARSFARKASRERGFKRQMATFSNLWLEGRYGWRPLCHDISDALQAVNESTPSWRRRKGTYAAESLNGSGSKSTNGSIARVNTTSVRTGMRTYRGFALAEGTIGNGIEFRPFQTAWELVPFSFIVDWFFDIGSSIAAATPIPGVDVRASGYSIKTEYDLVRTWDKSLVPGVTGYTVSTSQTGAYRVYVRDYERRPSGVMLPRFYPRLNNLKLVDLGALVFQRALPLSRFITKR